MSTMRGVLQRIATGPELSKDLSRDEAREAMAAVLDGRAHQVEAAVFLIALRMKRETDDENLGVLDALRASADRAVAEVDDVVEVSDPYDGFLRHLPAAPFLPAVLAACGLPAVSHGCRELPPKRGLTHARVLAAARASPPASTADAARRVADPRIGWAYLDVAVMCPALAGLAELRDLIVKRPLLNTVEKLLAPVQGRERTHLVVGYVHTAYETLLLRLARAVGYASALNVRGVEGGVVPPLSAKASARGYRVGSDDMGIDLDPTSLGASTQLRAPERPDDAGDLDAYAAAAAKAGLAALQGARGATRDALIQAASAILAHVAVAPARADAAALVRAVLDDGRAYARFTAS